MGRLIVFEGIDCSGKSTQSKLLGEYLNCPVLHFPYQVSKSIEEIRHSNSDLTNHLLMAANRLEMQSKIKEYLSKGDLILDRYTYSGIAYGMARGLSPKWCIDLESQLIQPDIIIYMDMDYILASKRKGYGEGENEKITFQSQVYWAYNGLLEKNINNAKLIRINANDDKDKITQLIKNKIPINIQ